MDEIYKRIKELRKQKDYTLKDLSEKTGLSVSFLSQIERGATSLAITSLKKIADAFELPITSFFEESVSHNYRVKVEEQKSFRIETSNSEYVRISGEFPGRMLESIIITIDPNVEKDIVHTHQGEELYYVLEGVVIFNIDGEEYLVKSGESIHFPSTLPHYWSNPLNQPSKLLSVLTPVIF
ncbi:helix-turn-helix domain-containing protein [Gottfriedia sp. NPDC057991]|uniref:helix-turn-helix domain-containing protein n=1 Tax=Gottfriedia sp. NPDC057991 TaxID=3346298 RepID=UPI0036D7A117